MLLERGQVLLHRVVDPDVDHLEPRPLEHHPHEVLADVVDVALDGADDDLADRFGPGLGQERTQDRHPPLHRVGGHQDLGDEQDAVAEVHADDAHALDEGLVEHARGAPAAPEEEVRALLDLLLEAVVEIVVHLLDQLAVVELGEDDVLLVVRVDGIVHRVRSSCRVVIEVGVGVGFTVGVGVGSTVGVGVVVGDAASGAMHGHIERCGS